MRHFALPDTLTDEELRTRLSEIAPLRPHGWETVSRAWLDTFDGALERRGLIAEHETGAAGTVLRLRNRHDGRDLRAVGAPANLPLFAAALREGPLRSELIAMTQPRALLPVLCSRDRQQLLECVDVRDKVVARLLVVRRHFIDGTDRARRRPLRRACLEPLRGFEPWARRVRRLLIDELQLRELDMEPLDEGLALAGLTSPASRLPTPPEFVPGQRTDVATRAMTGYLIRILRHNENGARDAIDPEFLHDFRVAVRRLRTLLAQMRRALPAATTARLQREFKWLAGETGEARDLDVLTLRFPEYVAMADVQADATGPLISLLAHRRETAHRRVRTALTGARYRALLAAADRFVSAAPSRRPVSPLARRPLEEVAGERIARLYRRARHHGARITDDSPASALHELRKDCKKLRYMIDLFGSRIAPESSRTVLKPLRRLQDILGDHQDFEVHGDLFQGLAEGIEPALPAESAVACAILAARLYDRQAHARERFTATFARFDRRKVRRSIKASFQRTESTS